MKTNELSGMALDYAVAKCKGVNEKAFLQFYEGDVEDNEPPEFHYSTDWALGGAIIEREKISLVWMQFSDEQYWLASIDVGSPEAPKECEMRGANPLETAMCCYVASKLGDEVQIPEEVYEQQSDS